MKRLIVLAIVATMVMGLAVAASAAFDTQWVVNIKVGTDAAVTQNGSQGSFATKIGAADGVGVGAEDGKLLDTTPAGTFYIYSTDLTGGTYIKDVRGSFTGGTKTWNLAIGRVGADQTGSVYLQVQNPAEAFGSVTNDFLSGGETIKLFSGSTLVWEANSASNTAFKTPTAYALGSTFQLVVSDGVVQPPVPEPSSIVAMFSGLVGLAGFGIRRRK